MPKKKRTTRKARRKPRPKRRRRPRGAKGRKVSLKALGTPKFLAAACLIFLAGAASGAVAYFAAQEFSDSLPTLYLENARVASTPIAAVDSEGNGVIASVSVTVAAGDGSVYYSIEPKVQVDLQYSAETAVEVAAAVIEVGLGGSDVSFSIEAPAEIVGGPSAGAAMTVITIAAIENRQVRPDVVITGTIREDGSIGLVGEILAKAEAAEEAGMALFLVPEGQYVEVYEQAGASYGVTYKSISWLQNYAQEEGWGLQIQEVSTVAQAAELMLQ